MCKNIWFSSDFHFGHNNIIKLCNRPTTQEEHDEWLLNRINSVVNEWDDFYILGDVSFKSPGGPSRIVELLKRMNGQKRLIIGNHDKHNWYLDKEVFKSIHDIYSLHVTGEFGEIALRDKLIVLCHYPIAKWASMHWGSWHLHGHCHGSFENYGLSIDVGVDANNWFPISIEEVYNKLMLKTENNIK
jgi:calcineurin-like phosphoesterase family protein